MLDLRLPFSVTDGKICYHADRRSEEERWLDDVSMEDDLFFSVVMDGITWHLQSSCCVHSSLSVEK